MGRRGTAIALAAVLVAVAPGIAGASGRPPSTRYVDGTIMTWNPRTGASVWTATPPHGSYYDLNAVGPSVVVASSGRCNGDALVRSHPVAFDARTGKSRWSSKVARVVLASDTGRGIVVMASSNRKQVVGLSAKTGTRRWTIASSTVVGTNPTTVFVRSSAGTMPAPLDARDRATGRSRWTYAMPPETAPGFTSLVVASNARLTVIASGGFLGGSSITGVYKPIGSTILFTLDSVTGREVARTVVDDPELTFSHGVLHDGVLALVNGHEIIGINLAARTLVWRHPIPAPSANFRGVLASGLGGRIALFADAARKSALALDTVTGATIWSRPTLTPVSLAGAASVVFLTPLGPATKAPIEAVDVATGRTRWTRTLRSTYAVPEPVLSQRGIAPMSVQCGTP